jgi:hypothetical protein
MLLHTAEFIIIISSSSSSTTALRDLWLPLRFVTVFVME